MKKAIVTITLLLVMIVLTTGCGVLKLNNYREYSHEDIIALFQNDKKEFEKINEILLNVGDRFPLVEGKATIFSTNDAKVDEKTKKYFTTVEWEEISRFFDETSVVQVNRYPQSANAFSFTGKNIHYDIFYFGDISQIARRNRFPHFEDLGGGWYLGYTDELGD